MGLYWNTPPTTTVAVYNEPLSAEPQLYVFQIQFGEATEANGQLFISVEQNSGTYGSLCITGVQVSEGTEPCENIQITAPSSEAERKRIEQSLLE
jgi:hypothetical protein